MELSEEKERIIKLIDGSDQNDYLDKRLMDIFIMVGISAHLQGYRYLKDCVKLVIAQPTYINQMTKRMYPIVALKNNTTACKVERAMRNALDTATIKGKIQNLNNILNVEILLRNEKPTNSEFIALLADFLSLETRNVAV